MFLCCCRSCLLLCTCCLLRLRLYNNRNKATIDWLFGFGVTGFEATGTVTHKSVHVVYHMVYYYINYIVMVVHIDYIMVVHTVYSVLDLLFVDSVVFCGGLFVAGLDTPCCCAWWIIIWWLCLNVVVHHMMYEQVPVMVS